MTADIGKVYPKDIQALRSQLGALGELLDRERLERMAEIDELRLELQAMKKLGEELTPGFSQKFEQTLHQERWRWNPELRRHEA